MQVPVLYPLVLLSSFLILSPTQSFLSFVLFAGLVALGRRLGQSMMEPMAFVAALLGASLLPVQDSTWDVVVGSLLLGISAWLVWDGSYESPERIELDDWDDRLEEWDDGK